MLTEPSSKLSVHFMNSAKKTKQKALALHAAQIKLY
jgi:hypothetical protein